MLLLVPQEAIENKSGGLTQVKSAVRRSFAVCPAVQASRDEVWESEAEQGMPKPREMRAPPVVLPLVPLLPVTLLHARHRHLQYVVPYANSTRRQYL